MISKISIKNFRSIKSAEIDLAPITIFYGPTASGKSSLLYAPLVLRNFVTNPGQKLDAFFNLGFIDLGGFESCIFDHSEYETIDMGLTGDYFGETIYYGISLSNYSVEITTALGDFKMTAEVFLPYNGNKNFSFSYVKDGEEYTVNWNGFAVISVIPKIETENANDEAEDIAFRLNRAIEMVRSLDISPHRRGFFKPIYSPVTVSASSIPTTEEEVASIIINNEYAGGRISRYSQKICDRDFRLYPIPGTAQVKFQTTDKISGVHADLVNEGFGINQIIYLWAKLLREEVETEFIEEPEAHLHPSIIRNFVRVLSEFIKDNTSDKQVVLATHSEPFIASLLASVREKLIPAHMVQCYLSEKVGKISSFSKQQVNDEGQIEGGLASFIEAELEDVRSLLGV